MASSVQWCPRVTQLRPEHRLWRRTRGGHGTPLEVLAGEGRIAGTVGSVPACCLPPVASLGFPTGGNQSPTRAISPWGGPDPGLAPSQGSLCPQCRCRPGFRLKDDGRTCADVDECSTTFPCSQLCINTHGSYKCLCVEGYSPRSGDPHSCKAVTGEVARATAGCCGGRAGTASSRPPGDQGRQNGPQPAAEPGSSVCR